MTTAEIVEKTSQENANKNASSAAKKQAAIAQGNAQNAAANQASSQVSGDDAYFMGENIVDGTPYLSNKNMEQILTDTYNAAHRDPRSEMNAAQKLWDTVSGEQKIREEGNAYHAKANGAMGIPDAELVQRWQNSDGDDKRIYAAEIESRGRDLNSPLREYASAAQMDRMRDAPLKDLGGEAAMALAGAKMIAPGVGKLRNAMKDVAKVGGKGVGKEFMEGEVRDMMVDFAKKEAKDLAKNALIGVGLSGGGNAVANTMGAIPKPMAIPTAPNGNVNAPNLNGNNGGEVDVKDEFGNPMGNPNNDLGIKFSNDQWLNEQFKDIFKKIGEKEFTETETGETVDQTNNKVDDTSFKPDNGGDIENSSTNTGSTPNIAIPVEPGFDNNAIKEQEKKLYEQAQNDGLIGVSEDPNKANYVNDEWNQGMTEESTDVVSDERCKKFISNVSRHEPAFRNGAKKITVIKRG